MKRKQFKTTLVTMACVACISTAGSAVFAQENEEVSAGLFLEEIIVTARKREESTQDVPLSITAFSGQQLQALGANESGDIALFTPNFTWNTEFGRASPQPYLRGVGSNGFAPNNVNPIAVYTDNVVIGPNIAQGFAAFDIDRVEVLKGPQGTLYGRNATGGLINFISVKPEIGDGFSGFAQAEAGSFGTLNIEAALEGDLGEKSAYRLSVASNKNDGLFDNRFLGGRSGTTDDIAGRLQVRVQPNENLDILFNAHFGDASPDVAPFKAIGTICPPGVTVPTVGVCASGAGTDTADLFSVASGFTQEDVETSGGFLNIKYDFENLTLTSITAIENSELRRLDDTDNLPAFQDNDHFADEFETVSQEVRLSGNGEKSTWHIGGFYYKEDYEGDFLADAAIFGVSLGNVKTIDTESYALFGQYDYQINDRFRASAGLRYTNEDKELTYTAFVGSGGLGTTFFGDNNNPAIVRFVEANAADKEDFSDVSGRFSLDYNLSDSVLVYGSYARGFKAGDVNGLSLETDPAALAITSNITDPETLDAFELGFKGDFADGRLRVNAAAFYYDYKDQQQSILQPVPGSLAAVTTFANAGRSKIPGAELDIVWSPTNEWLILTSLGYVDATYDEYVVLQSGDPASIVDNSGNRAPLTPEFEATLLVSRDFTFNGGGVLTVQANGRYQSEIFFQPTNEPGLSEGSQTVFGARIAYTPPSERWEFSVSADNITDEQFFVAGFNFDLPGINSLMAKTNTPRIITAKLRVDF